MPGTLFVVATPIGNLEDLTFRALRTLKEVDVIAAEDTRRTSKLLAHYAVQKPLISLHEHNESREAPRLVERMVAGACIALVSDAGTPGISDPGQLLVRLAREAGVQVSPIPGPSAITAALSVSGLKGTGFRFMGFPPPTGSARTEWLSLLGDESQIVVFFEAPHRIVRTLADVAAAYPKRPIVINREITKTHEELVIRPIVTGLLSEQIKEKGEFVVIVGHSDNDEVSELDLQNLMTASSIIGLMTEHGYLSDRQAIDAAAAGLGVRPNRLRRALKKAAIQAKRSSTGSS